MLGGAVVRDGGAAAVYVSNYLPREANCFVPDRFFLSCFGSALPLFLVVVDVRSELTREREGRQDEEEGGVCSRCCQHRNHGE